MPTQNPIPIFFAFDDNYCEHALVAMASLLANTASPVVFYVMHTSLSEDNIKRLRSLETTATTPQQITLQFVKIDKAVFKDFKMCLNGITLETCFRLMIAELFPQLDKVIYLDSDLVVRHDIAELYNTNIENVFAGVVEDLFGVCSYQELFASRRYFNAGVLLLNTKKIRENITLSDFLKIEREHRDVFWFQDQDVLNFAFAGNVYFLPPKWNATHCFFLPRRKMPPQLGYSLAEIISARENPAIAHFVSKGKPWRIPCGLAASPYATEYFKYANTAHKSGGIFSALLLTLRHPDRILKSRNWEMARVRQGISKTPLFSLRTTRKIAHLLSAFLWKKDSRDSFRDSLICAWIKRNLFTRYKHNCSPLWKENKNTSPVPKIIWQLWWQGRNAAPNIVKNAIASVQKMARENNYKHIVLSSENIADYISIPETILRDFHAGNISIPNFSDVVRLELLRKHGGIWIDATCFIENPFPEWLENCDFFIYQTIGKITKRNLIQSCFIASKPHSELIEAWAWCVREFWKIEHRSSEYFYIHKIFKTLIQNDENLRRQFDKIPRIDNDLTHRLLESLNSPFDAEQFRAMLNTPDALFQKTYYPKDGKKFPPNSFGAILEQENFS